MYVCYVGISVWLGMSLNPHKCEYVRVGVQDSKLGPPGKSGIPLQGLLRDWTTVGGRTHFPRPLTSGGGSSAGLTVLICSFLPQCHSPSFPTLAVLGDVDKWTLSPKSRQSWCTNGNDFLAGTE